MIRHSRRQGEAISFFAFLSVISCTIGALMVVLVCVSVTSFFGAKQSPVLPSKGDKPGWGVIYVECDAEGLRVHPDDVLVSRKEVEDPHQWSDGPFGQCLRKVRSHGADGAVYFLIRRGGIPVFRTALGYAVALGGGTTDAVQQGDALFSIGQQLVVMPGAIRVAKPAEPEPTAGS